MQHIPLMVSVTLTVMLNIGLLTLHGRHWQEQPDDCLLHKKICCNAILKDAGT